MRSAHKITGLKPRIIMKSQSTGRNSRRPRRGGPRRRFDTRDDRAPSRAPAKKSFWQKVAAFFGGADSSVRPVAPSRNGAPQMRNGAPRPERVSRKPESIEVTTPRLYVGN